MLKKCAYICLNELFSLKEFRPLTMLRAGHAKLLFLAISYYFLNLSGIEPARENELLAIRSE